MKTKPSKLPPKKTQPLKRFAVWHTGGSPEIVEGFSATVTGDGVTISQGPDKSRVITGVIMVTEPSDKMKFL